MISPNISSTSARFAEFMYEWSINPVQGVRDLFGAEPTNQQIELIRSAWDPSARVAVSSCTGAGKTTVLAWLTFLFLLTQDDCRILVTSPSFQQLTRVFHAEMLKWRGKMPSKISDMFEVTRERVIMTSKTKVQVANLVTASADNKESLQGGHAGNYVILADEASGIEEATFDVLYRTLSTGTGGRFILTSNPTRSVGRFYDIFHKDLPEWDKMYFKAFDCPHLAPGFVQGMIDTYGEDSDHYRIGVLGAFPRTTNSQFISAEVVDNAIHNNLPFLAFHNYPIVIGADIARFGDDETVFVARQGPRVLNITQLKGLDTQEVAAALMEYHKEFPAKVIFIDAIGIGAGVFDRCKHLKMPVKEVMGSHKSSKPMEYFNMRSQLWGEMRHWVNNGADIPLIDELRSQLIGMTYGYTAKMQIALTTKKDIKKQGLKSPDIGDAIALTFADAVYGSASFKSRPRKIRKSRYLYV
jgi:Ni2+-binding GTPase involved in maturation of urease and hydrogenase